VATVLEVEGTIHVRHTTAADFGLDGVTIVKFALQVLDVVAQWAARLSMDRRYRARAVGASACEGRTLPSADAARQRDAYPNGFTFRGASATLRWRANLKTAHGPMERPIVGYRLDDEGDWIAELACGHSRHVRHNPPWEVREWVVTAAGREGRIGTLLDCRACNETPHVSAVVPR